MSQLDFIRSKIMDENALKKALERWKLKGLKLVFTNGVFDIVHRGHITLLQQAAEQGDVLILGLNSDSSVRRLGKGADRPINGEADRAFVLAGMSAISAIVIFDADTPIDLVRLVQPDILLKGGDYDPDQDDQAAKDYIVGSDLQRAAGRLTVAIDLVHGYSTTSVVKKLRDGQN